MPRDSSTLHTCQRCGVSFVPHRGAPGKYCSRTCSNRTNAKPSKYPFERVCPGCGVTHIITVSRTASVFCSGKCAKQTAARTVRGTSHPLWKPKVVLTCPVCGAKRAVKPSLVSRFRGCSSACTAALGRKAPPRTSSLETRMAEAMSAIGLHPQPQAPFGPYTVDFAFPEAKVVVECDGAYWHSLPKQQRIDRSKDTFLTNRGWQVIRLPEAAIKANPAACAERVLLVVMAAPPVPGSRQDGS